MHIHWFEKPIFMMNSIVEFVEVVNVSQAFVACKNIKGLLGRNNGHIRTNKKRIKDCNRRFKEQRNVLISPAGALGCKAGWSCPGASCNVPE